MSSTGGCSATDACTNEGDAIAGTAPVRCQTEIETVVWKITPTSELLAE